MATVETFIKAAQIKPDGYLPGGLPFVRASTLDRLAKDTRTEPLRKTAAPVKEFERTAYEMAAAIAKGLPADQIATIAHRAEVIRKARLREEDPVNLARNRKLAAIDTERKRLEGCGMSPNEAINQAMRNLAAQNNSPGSR